jgi:hypothetical protein
MNDSDIPSKTATGSDELKNRSGHLPQRLRTLLIMVDGNLTVAELRLAGSRMGAPEDGLEQLLVRAFIAVANSSARAPVAALSVGDASGPVQAQIGRTGRAPLSEGDRFRAAQKFMNDSAVDTLGLRAFFFTLKLEKSFTCDDLRALLPDFSKALTNGGGPEMARVLEARVREILG